MSKELEAVKLLKIEYDKLDYTIEIDGLDIIEIITQALEELETLRKKETPPTADDVCKALSEYLGICFRYNGKNFHTNAFCVNWVNSNGTIFFNIDLPPHLITLIGRFYESEVKGE